MIISPWQLTPQKINPCIRKFLIIEKAKILGNTCIDSQFNYAPLIWMFCKKTSYTKIEKIHHRTLKVICGIDDSYSNLLLSSNSVSIHQRHLRFLVTEIFKSISQINLEFMWPFFKWERLSYNLRRGPILNLPRTHSIYYGTNAIHFRGPLTWNNLPAKVKSSNSVFEFKTKVKNLGNIDCGCLIAGKLVLRKYLFTVAVIQYIFLLQFISLGYFCIATVNKDLKK